MSDATKNPAPKNKGGRPTGYRSDYARMAYRHCLLGSTDKQLADLFGVSPRTIDLWKKRHPEFLRSLKKGRNEADALVAEHLYKRACGFTRKAVKIFNDGGEPLVVPYTEYFPPDTTAAIFWLKNRQPARWRDKQQHDVSVTGSAQICIPDNGRESRA